MYTMICNNCFTAELQKPWDDHPSYLVCPNCGAIQLTYEPQDYQEALHQVPYVQIRDPETGLYLTRIQIIGVFGGYGSGKSKASLQEFFMRALENPGGTGAITAPTLPQLKKTTLKTFFSEICPPPLLDRDYGNGSGYNKADGIIKLVNGFEIYVVPSDDEDKIRSLNIGLVHMEEASGIKRSIFDQFLARMRNQNTRNKAIFVSSNPDLGWIKEVLVENEKRKDPRHPEHAQYNPAIVTFNWPTRLNKHLPPDFIEVNTRGKPDWWVKRYIEGSFEHSEGMVYPNVSRCFRTSSEFGPIKRDWERFVTMDFGIANPTAVLFHAIDRETGTIITYDEHYFAGQTVPWHAERIKQKLREIPDGLLLFMVADPSIKAERDPRTGKNVQTLYQEYGIYWSLGNNKIEAGILKVNSYIERRKWIILTDKCPNLAREIVNYKWPEVTMDDADENRPEKPVKARDHACDSVRYGFMLLPDDPERLKTEGISPSYPKAKQIAPDDWDDDEDYGERRSWLEYV